MGLFDFLKGKDKNSSQETKEGKVYSPVNGKLVAIDEVADPVFSQKMMGDGFAVIPTDGDIYSPVDGKVMSVFPTKHAVGIAMDNGVEVLVHMGLDTVELEGKPFMTTVTEGQEVTKDTKISTVDLEALAAAEKDNAMVVVFTNMDKVGSFDMIDSGSTVTAAGDIGSVTAK
ncbi:MAG: PTS glucose transporter subunit IIA [Desemzia incerta]